MSSVNPISVREQLKQSQSDFQRLLIDGKLSSEAEALFSGLLRLSFVLIVTVKPRGSFPRICMVPYAVVNDQLRRDFA